MTPCTVQVPLVMATCAATGDLLQPSYPLTPLDRWLAVLASSSTQSAVALWGTYTAVPTAAATTTATTPSDDAGDPIAASHGAAAAVGLWWTAFAFCTSKDCNSTSTSSGTSSSTGSAKHPASDLAAIDAVVANVLESDLAPMVDEAHLPSDFSLAPTGAFHGGGTTFPAGPAGWVAWKGDFMKQRTAGCAAVHVVEWSSTGNNTVALTMDGGDAILNVAPLIGGQHALLGEQGKVAAISTYRFSSVAAGAGGDGIVVRLRGKPAEVVTLLFATRQSVSSTSRDGGGGPFACTSVAATIKADGTASVAFPS